MEHKFVPKMGRKTEPKILELIGTDGGSELPDQVKYKATVQSH